MLEAAYSLFNLHYRKVDELYRYPIVRLTPITISLGLVIILAWPVVASKVWKNKFFLPTVGKYLWRLIHSEL